LGPLYHLYSIIMVAAKMDTAGTMFGELIFQPCSVILSSDEKRSCMELTPLLEAATDV
jgi:hypothetical protein